MSSEEQVIEWIRAQQGVVDGAVAASGRRFVDRQGAFPLFGFELSEVIGEAGHLNAGKSLCYDRPTVALNYVLWYQGRRVNTMVSLLLKAWFQSDQPHTLQVFDMGAGTGAVAMAMGLIREGVKAVLGRDLQLSMVNLDSSPFMLDYLEQDMWPAFVEAYPRCEEVEMVYELNSWYSADFGRQGSPWVVCSYLFDYDEGFDALKDGFQSMMDLLSPSMFIFQTISRKKAVVGSAMQWMEKAGFAERRVDLIPPFSGVMETTVEVRKQIGHQCGVRWLTSRAPSWGDSATQCWWMENTRPRLALEVTSGDLQMYRTRLESRLGVRLNALQRKAADWPEDIRPMCISGAAGSGKSLVLTEKVFRLLEQPPKGSGMRPYDPRFRILITTFNKALNATIKGWIVELLGNRARIIGEGIWLKDSRVSNIDFHHFDILPRRGPAKVRNRNRFSVLGEEHAKEQIETIIRHTISELGWRREQWGHALSPDFLFEESLRIMYGKSVSSKEEYMNMDRRGRGQKLGQRQREVVYEVIHRWWKKCEAEKRYPFHLIRRLFSTELEANSSWQQQYDFIFVDEYQDCTEADFNIFYRLVKDPNHIVLAGDLAQAVHLGSTSAVPRFSHSDTDGAERQRNIDYRQLEGSYRLPLSISRCIQPLTESIQMKQSDATVIRPYKGAPPGARPLVIAAQDDRAMAQKILAALHRFAPYHAVEGALTKATLMEKDWSLFRALSILSPGSVAVDSILRLKGLEMPAVIWSTRIPPDNLEDALEYIYTILSRSSGMVIIALYPELEKEIQGVIRQLEPDWLMPWCPESRLCLNQILSHD